MAVVEERDEVDELNDLNTDWDEDEFDDEIETHSDEIRPIWQKIRRFFFMTSAEKREDNRQRMSELTQSIEAYPDAAANYLLRGELHTDLQQYDLAQEDFEKALALAETQYENDRWGLASQAIQDRARSGLKRIARYNILS